MASATVVVDEVGANDLDRDLVLAVKRYAISLDRGDFKLVIDIKDHIDNRKLPQFYKGEVPLQFDN